MKKVLARLVRQSPAMIVAMLALFVALTGTAVATTSALLITGKQIKDGSITGLDIKNKSLGVADLASKARGARGARGLAGPPGPAGAAGAAGAQGLQGPQGPGARWAAVASDASIVRQSGGITAAVAEEMPGIYIVDFGADISRQLILVSPAIVGDMNFRGVLTAGGCTEPDVPSDFCGENPQNKAMVVSADETNATQAPHSFYVAAMGPTAAGAAPAARPSGGSKGALLK